MQTPSDISQKGLKAECSLCSQAVDLFLEVIGAEAGHMALRSLATGGVYIAGAPFLCHHRSAMLRTAVLKLTLAVCTHLLGGLWQNRAR